jgi:TetR/AcrR family tetracycline transcriptional repressor
MTEADGVTVSRRGRLTRQMILETALDILTTQGLAALTMRGLAQRLGVEAMSLYNHVADKRDLLAGLVGLVIGGIEPPDPTLPWPVRLEAVMLRLYEALSAHPQLVMVLASDQAPQSDLGVLTAMDTVVGILEDAGLTPAQQVSAFRGLLAICFGLVMNHTLGFTVSPSAAQARFAEWNPSQLVRPETPRLAKLAPQFLATRASDDLRFMIDAFLRALGADARPQ